MNIIEKIEKNQFKLLAIYLATAFLLSVLSSLRLFTDKNDFQAVMWFLNYEGGFIRRGLIGQIFYELLFFIKVNPIFLVYLYVFFLYVIIFYTSFKLLNQQKNILGWLFLITSPYLFNFYHYYFFSGVYKDLIFIALLGLLTYFANNKNQNSFRKYFLLIVLFYQLLLLSHEMFIIFFPYLLIVYFYKVILEKKDFYILLFSSVVSLLVFFIIVIFGSNASAEKLLIMDESIFELIKISGLKRGYFDIYDKGLSYALEDVKRQFAGIKYHLITIIYTALALFPLKDRFMYVIKNKLILLSFLSLAVGNIILFMIAVDWPRWTYINISAIFYVLVLSKNDYIFPGEKNFINFIKRKPKTSIFLIMFYILIWFLFLEGQGIILLAFKKAGQLI